MLGGGAIVDGGALAGGGLVVDGEAVVGGGLVVDGGASVVGGAAADGELGEELDGGPLVEGDLLVLEGAEVLPEASPSADGEVSVVAGNSEAALPGKLLEAGNPVLVGSAELEAGASASVSFPPQATARIATDKTADKNHICDLRCRIFLSYC